MRGRQSLCASWGADDTIVFGQGAGGILRVSANGGTPEVLIPMDSDKNEMGQGPQMLPDGKTVLFALSTTTVTTLSSLDESQIVTQSLETGERRLLIEGGSDARYVLRGTWSMRWGRPFWRCRSISHGLR